MQRKERIIRNKIFFQEKGKESTMKMSGSNSMLLKRILVHLPLHRQIHPHPQQ